MQGSWLSADPAAVSLQNQMMLHFYRCGRLGLRRLGFNRLPLQCAENRRLHGWRLGVLLLLMPLVLHAQHRVLFIGNSFTIGAGGGGVPGIFDRLAQAGGHADPDTVMRAVGGQDFQFHSQDPTTLAAIASQPWTHVVLQNYSTEPTHLASGSVADHYTYGTALYEKVIQNNTQTQVILFETWSRAEAHALITGVSSPSSFASTAEFQTELRTNYHGLADFLTATHPTNLSVVVAPVGTAWEDAGGLREASDPLFVRLHGSDDYHGNNNGYYLAACVFYSVIYGASPHGLSTNSLITSLNLGFTVPPTTLEDFAWATVSGTSQIGLQSFLFDFGAVSALTTNGPAPGDPQNHWNNVTEAIGTSALGQISNLVTTGNTPTDIRLVMLNRFNGANLNGTTASASFPANATSDSLFGNTEPFNNLSNIFPSFKLTNLNPLRTYSLTFYASRMGVADNRETSYTVTGQNSGSAVLDAVNNTDATALVPAITPDASGEITISLAPTTNNNNSFHFTYLGAMRMDAVPGQEPIEFTQHPVSQTVIAGLPAMFNAAVQGTPPYFIQWSSNGVALPNANQFTFTIPSVTTNMDGAVFAVTVSNLAYAATSSNAVLHVTPATLNPAAKALFFDFGSATTTANGPSPNDPLNFWNNVTPAVGSTSSGWLTNLVTAANAPTTVGLVMLSRFNGANENGTLNAFFLPPNATRDSLFGNTETFSGLANIFPRFKLTGLNPAATYNLTFYASRLSAGDNRETGYTVQGANSGFATLNAADNVTNTTTVAGIIPTAAREITISLAPTANNNNIYHFTYLGVLRLDPVLPPPEFLPAVIANGQITLDWIGEGQLEWSPSLAGPWTPVAPQPSPPYVEDVVPGLARFFRIVTGP
jgi:hypothetical protein